MTPSLITEVKTAFAIAFSAIGIGIANLSKWLPENIGTLSAVAGLVLAVLTAVKVVLEVRILLRKLEEAE
jgi:cytochrome c biogenesis protein CcdA